uniref:Uncharacterized protein n=1 Tax=Coccidioides posadasii RMSCC 3488 TaxID=454284 RepID=A0A0J6FA78_COCPO|nr:hypothetical protein CPAG_02210 [Coccidioides posadasii RMSCC 3488]
MSSHRHLSSLERVLDFSAPLLLTPQQSDSARSLLDIFIKDYGLERATGRGYKSAKLIHATLDYISSKDSFLTLFFTFLHENLAGSLIRQDTTTNAHLKTESKKNVLWILDMFDPGITHLIHGPKIDSPSNALTLALDTTGSLANSRYISSLRAEPMNIGFIPPRAVF